MTDTKTVKFTNESQNKSITTSLTKEVRAFLHKHELHAWQALQGPLELSDTMFDELDQILV